MQAYLVFCVKSRYFIYYILFVSSFLGLLLFSGINFHQSLYRNVSELHLASLSAENSNVKFSDQTITLQAKMEGFLMPLPHDRMINARLLDWMSYSSRSLYYIAEMEDKILVASTTRPTWSPTYIQLFKLYWRVGNEDKAIEMLRLANMFGPNRTDTMLTSVDYTFAYWQFASQEDRLRASKQLLTISESWKHRSELNQMITYSPGKQRICNMLAFNKVKVSACQ